MRRIRRACRRVPRALVALGWLAMATIGSCSLPSIKPPSL